MTFGEKLQYLRKQNGLSQEQLASKLTVSRQAISKWELDASVPDTENVLQISDIFDVSTDYLLKEHIEQINDLSAQTQTPSSKVQKRIFDKIMIIVGGMGILIFYILSAIFPAVASYAEASADGEVSKTIVETGLPAFLKMNNMELLFALCCVVFLAGIAIYIIPIIKTKIEQKKQM